MSGVIDGQSVNASVTNAAFIFKNGADDMPYRFGLNSAIAGYGSAVTNSQRELNSLNSFLGKNLNSVYNDLPTWTSNNFGSPTDNILQRVTAIDSGISVVNSRKGIVNITNGQDNVTVTFSSPWTDSSYVPVYSFFCSDSNPIFLMSYISSKTSGGFVVKLNAPVDSANYKINYHVGASV